MTQALPTPCGFYIIDKPAGWTSFDVCAKVRKHLNTKKVGHTGTLDPFATGVLVIAVGKATKMIPYLEKATKTYEAQFTFGCTTESLDTEGDVLVGQTPETLPTYEDVEAVITSFIGEGTQVPPAHSAIKINGKRAYALARKGDKVDMPTRPTMVHNAELLSYQWPVATVRITVGAGFYVRSMARDVALQLGTVGYCTQLRRTAIADIHIDNAETIETLTELIDPQYIITHVPQTTVQPDRLNDWQAGRAFPHPGNNDDKYLVLCQGKTIGIGQIVDNKLQPRVVMPWVG